jgi:hypothetical protein
MISGGDLGCTLQILLLTYPLAVALFCLDGSRIRIRSMRRG